MFCPRSLDRLDALPDSARAPLRNEGYGLAPSERAYSGADAQRPADAPRGFVSGKGARATDLDGREWVDWAMGTDDVLIGHAEDVIDDAAIAAIRRGQALTGPMLVEVDLCRAPGGALPRHGHDHVRPERVGLQRRGHSPGTGHHGAQACRLRRDDAGSAFHDACIGHTVVDTGVPEAIHALFVPFRLNESDTVDALFAGPDEPPACVILEIARERTPRPGFLEHLRAKCDAHGALLIFDEVVTGFRYALHGLYSTLGVTPDLLTIGKGMANGHAIAALLGRREYMGGGGIRHGRERESSLSTTNGPERWRAAGAGLLPGPRCHREARGRGRRLETRARRRRPAPRHLRPRGDLGRRQPAAAGYPRARPDNRSPFA